MLSLPSTQSKQLQPSQLYDVYALDKRGRGANVIDLNADGLLDVVVVNRANNVNVSRRTGLYYPEMKLCHGFRMSVANRHSSNYDDHLDES